MIFVTGGTGLVGAHVILHLLSKGYPVKALRRPSASIGYFSRLASFYGMHDTGKLEWLEGDILDTGTLLPAMEGCSAVYHCAGMVSFDGAHWDRLLKINRGGTANVVNAALEKGISALCHVSSVAALDMSKGIKGKKTDWKIFRKEQPYGYSKYLGELEAYRGMEEGLNVVVVNPAVVIGPAQQGNPLNGLIRRLKNGLRFYPPGGTGYVGAADLARIMVHLMEEKAFGKAYTVATTHHSFRESLLMFAAAMNVQPPRKGLGNSHFLALKILLLGGRIIGKKPGGLSLPALASLKKTSVYDTTDLNSLRIGPFRKLEEDVEDTVRFSSL
jgi:dihydroflavonol-4-reductase